MIKTTHASPIETIVSYFNVIGPTVEYLYFFNFYSLPNVKLGGS